MIRSFVVKTEKQFTDITSQVNTFLTGLRSGVVNVFVKHTTCGLSILEDELLSLSDILDFLDTVIPYTKRYRHDCVGIRDVPSDERINGVSHVRMLLFPSSITIPFNIDGLCLGKWQHLFLVEMDWCVPFRERDVLVSIIPNRTMFKESLYED